MLTLNSGIWFHLLHADWLPWLSCRHGDDHLLIQQVRSVNENTSLPPIISASRLQVGIGICGRGMVFLFLFVTSCKRSRFDKGAVFAIIGGSELVGGMNVLTGGAGVRRRAFLRLSSF